MGANQGLSTHWEKRLGFGRLPNMSAGTVVGRALGGGAGSPSALTQAQTKAILGNLADNAKTDNYTLTTGDNVNFTYLGTATAADKTFTLPSVAAANDGLILPVANWSKYSLTVAPSDSDAVWHGGNGYGVVLPDQGTVVYFQYNDALTTWVPIHHTGGRMILEGWTLAAPMSIRYSESAQPQELIGQTRGIDTSQYQERNGPFTLYDQRCLVFDGSADDLEFKDWAGADIFDGNVHTICCWVRFDGLGSEETIFGQYEDASNLWRVYKTSGNVLAVQLRSGGADTIADTGSTVLSATTWYHVCQVVDSSGNVAVYLDGSQETWEATGWATDTFAGSFWFGNKGDDTTFLDGRACDLHICDQNYFNATPNSTPDDTFTIPTRPILPIATGAMI